MEDSTWLTDIAWRGPSYVALERIESAREQLALAEEELDGVPGFEQQREQIIVEVGVVQTIWHSIAHEAAQLAAAGKQ